MKNTITFLCLLVTAWASAQGLMPNFIKYLGNEYANNVYKDNNSNDLYLVYTESGEIKKINTSMPDPDITTIISGLIFPTDVSMIGSRLYVLEATNGMDDNGNPVQYTGKLSYYDVSQTPLVKVILYNDLNVPLNMEVWNDQIILEEPVFFYDQESDEIEIQEQNIFKLSLDSPFTKTFLFSSESEGEDKYIAKFKILNDKLFYSLETWGGEDESVGYFYQYDLVSNERQLMQTIEGNAINLFTISGNSFYYTKVFEGDKIYKSALDFSDEELLVNGVLHNDNPLYLDNLESSSTGNIYFVGYRWDIETDVEQYYLFSLNDPLSIHQQESINVQIYPNPAYEMVNLSIDLRDVIIYNVSGSIVKTYTDYTNLLDLSDLSSGVYFIRGYTLDGNYISKKMIKK